MKLILTLAIVLASISSQASFSQRRLLENLDLSASVSRSPSGPINSRGSGFKLTIFLSTKIQQMSVRTSTGTWYRRLAQFTNIEICRVEDTNDIFVETQEGSVLFDLPEFPSDKAKLVVKNIIDESGNNYTKDDPINFKGNTNFNLKLSKREFKALSVCR